MLDHGSNLLHVPSCNSVVLEQALVAEDPGALSAARLAQADGSTIQHYFRWPRPVPLQDLRASLVREVSCAGRSAPMACTAKAGRMWLRTLFGQQPPTYRLCLRCPFARICQPVSRSSMQLSQALLPITSTRHTPVRHGLGLP